MAPPASATARRASSPSHALSAAAQAAQRPGRSTAQQLRRTSASSQDRSSDGAGNITLVPDHAGQPNEADASTASHACETTQEGLSLLEAIPEESMRRSMSHAVVASSRNSSQRSTDNATRLPADTALSAGERAALTPGGSNAAASSITANDLLQSEDTPAVMATASGETDSRRSTSDLQPASAARSLGQGHVQAQASPSAATDLATESMRSGRQLAGGCAEALPGDRARDASPEQILAAPPETGLASHGTADAGDSHESQRQAPTRENVTGSKLDDYIGSVSDVMLQSSSDATQEWPGASAGMLLEHAGSELMVEPSWAQTTLALPKTFDLSDMQLAQASQPHAEEMSAAGTREGCQASGASSASDQAAACAVQMPGTACAPAASPVTSTDAQNMQACALEAATAVPADSGSSGISVQEVNKGAPPQMHGAATVLAAEASCESVNGPLRPQASPPDYATITTATQASSCTDDAHSEQGSRAAPTAPDGPQTPPGHAAGQAQELVRSRSALQGLRSGLAAFKGSLLQRSRSTASRRSLKPTTVATITAIVEPKQRTPPTPSKASASADSGLKPGHAVHADTSGASVAASGEPADACSCNADSPPQLQEPELSPLPISAVEPASHTLVVMPQASPGRSSTGSTDVAAVSAAAAAAAAAQANNSSHIMLKASTDAAAGGEGHSNAQSEQGSAVLGVAQQLQQARSQVFTALGGVRASLQQHREASLRSSSRAVSSSAHDAGAPHSRAPSSEGVGAGAQREALVQRLLSVTHSLEGLLSSVGSHAQHHVAGSALQAGGATVAGDDSAERAQSLTLTAPFANTKAAMGDVAVDTQPPTVLNSAGAEGEQAAERCKIETARSAAEPAAPALQDNDMYGSTWRAATQERLPGGMHMHANKAFETVRPLFSQIGAHDLSAVTASQRMRNGASPAEEAAHCHSSAEVAAVGVMPIHAPTPVAVMHVAAQLPRAPSAPPVLYKKALPASPTHAEGHAASPRIGAEWTQVSSKAISTISGSQHAAFDVQPGLRSPAAPQSPAPALRRLAQTDHACQMRPGSAAPVLYRRMWPAQPRSSPHASSALTPANDLQLLCNCCATLQVFHSLLYRIPANHRTLARIVTVEWCHHCRVSHVASKAMCLQVKRAKTALPALQRQSPRSMSSPGPAHPRKLQARHQTCASIRSLQRSGTYQHICMAVPRRSRELWPSLICSSLICNVALASRRWPLLAMMSCTMRSSDCMTTTLILSQLLLHEQPAEMRSSRSPAHITLKSQAATTALRTKLRCSVRAASSSA